MPIIEMHLMTGRSVEQKRAVAAAITEAVCTTLGVKAETVRILVTEHGSEDFSVAGMTAGLRTERQQESEGI
ncbi:4-oxalocrotonate tautomerase family protein [Methyloversatilis sp.]|uniref:tautomerase family protein n=1 Tax=Methyloversatilis sp. TaxID=2569862 RepID=UPI003525B050